MKEVTADQKRLVSLYKMHGINMDILPDERVLVEQRDVYNGYLLTQKQLARRAKEIFPERHTVPKVVELDTDIVTPEWVRGRMKELDLYGRDLSRQTTLDEQTVSRLINGKRPMTKAVKALFYYYFLTYELNRKLHPDDFK